MPIAAILEVFRAQEDWKAMVVEELPFTEEKIGDQKFLRYFDSSRSEEMVWHQDPEDRNVRLLEGRGWMLQLDENLPVTLAPGMWHKIPKLEWHRLIALPGCTNAVFEVHKLH